MKITGIKCYCGRVLFSRTRHDFRKCICGEDTYIDGGLDYVRYGWTNGKPCPPTVSFELDITSPELYDDYNHRTNKYGIIEIKDQNGIDITEHPTMT